MLTEIVAVCAPLAGALTGFLLARRYTSAPDNNPEPVCGCNHHLALHDPQTGVCHEQVPAGTWTTRVCACRQYVGPHPVDEFFTTDVAWDSAVMRRGERA